MSKIEIKDAEEISVPKKKDIFAGGEKVGEIKPWINNNQLKWHACIKLLPGFEGIPLAQACDDTPEKAVLKSMQNYQDQINESIEALKVMKARLGLDGE